MTTENIQFPKPKITSGGTLHINVFALPDCYKNKFRCIRFQEDVVLQKLTVFYFTDKDDQIKNTSAPHCNIFAPAYLDKGEVLDVYNFCLNLLQNEHRKNINHWIHKY